MLDPILGLDWYANCLEPSSFTLRYHLGWFPFLFYGPTWVGETYMRYSAPEHVKYSTDTLGEIGRIGSLSLVVFSIITFAGSVLLPLLVDSPEDEKSGFTPRPPPSIAPLIKTLNQYRPDLLTAWMLSHLIFAGAMFLAPFVQSLHFATILVSICGMYVHIPLIPTPYVSDSPPSTAPGL